LTAPRITLPQLTSISRVSLDLELQKQFARLMPGVVLDVGSKHSPYAAAIPQTRYLRLDLDPGTNPDICCDIERIDWESDYFDTVIATEVLEHVLHPDKAVDEIRRILKPGGICILSTRFMFPYHPDPHDYFRFSQDSLAHLFRDFTEAEIRAHGNRLQVVWQLLSSQRFGLPLQVLNPLVARMNVRTTAYPLGFVVRARK
jgi:SAM-dependent methyltransferase